MSTVLQPEGHLQSSPEKSPDDSKSTISRRMLGNALLYLPTLAILSILGGVAVLGHQMGWKMPSFAQLTGNGLHDRDDWCDAHGVSESDCVLCAPNSKWKPKSYGWCSQHGVHDCPYEHPELAQTKIAPKITKDDLARAKKSLDFVRRPKNSPRCKLHPSVIQLASVKMVDKLGLAFEPAWRKSIEEIVTANGEITYDATRIASLSSILTGKVHRVQKQVGDVVKKGDVLAVVDCVGVGKAKAEFLQALAEFQLRKKTLRILKPLGGSAVPEAKILEVEAALVKAEAGLVSAEQALNNLGIPAKSEQFENLSSKEINRRMQFLGLPKSVVATLDPTTTTANLIAVRTPLDGVVVERKVVEGELVDPSNPLFIVADPTTMWLRLHVPASDAHLIRLGQEVRFQYDGNAKQAIGEVSWISTSVDDKTRTLQVRAVLQNADGRLRANTFGAGTIVLRREDKAIVVPNSAIHSDGNCNIVFVQDKNFFESGHPVLCHVRTVQIGAITPTGTEIIAGVLPEENVAVRGGGVLRMQLLKNNLGAG